MCAPTPDLSYIDELRRLNDASLIAAFARARDRGDADAARDAWQTLVIRHYDRIHGIVAAFRFPGHEQVRIADGDLDDATQEAFLRVLNKLKFRGVSEGEFLKALRRATRFSCMDHCRRTLARERHERGSMNEVREQPTALERELGDVAEALHEDERHGREDMDELLSALPEVPSENMRAVILFTLDGMPLAEIAAQLRTSHDNAYQLRSRGLRKLKEVMAARAGAA